MVNGAFGAHMNSERQVSSILVELASSISMYCSGSGCASDHRRRIMWLLNAANVLRCTKTS